MRKRINAVASAFFSCILLAGVFVKEGTAAGDKLSLGSGIPYGGVGVNGEILLNNYVGLTGGLGSFYGDLGWAFGGRFYLNSYGNEFRWRLTLLYGIVEQVESSYSGDEETETVTGALASIGFQWKFAEKASLDLDLGYSSPSESSVTITHNIPGGTTKVTTDTEAGTSISVGLTYHF